MSTQDFSQFGFVEETREGDFADFGFEEEVQKSGKITSGIKDTGRQIAYS